jgi:hypothetical protein
MPGFSWINYIDRLDASGPVTLLDLKLTRRTLVGVIAGFDLWRLRSHFCHWILIDTKTFD